MRRGSLLTFIPILTSACGGDAAIIDAGSADACLLLDQAAVTGTIVDPAGEPLEPTMVEAQAEPHAEWWPCEVNVEEDAVSYACSNRRPLVITTELPNQTYGLRFTLGPDSWEWERELVRRDNCFVDPQVFDVVLPPE